MTFRSPIFRKLLASSLAIILVTLVALDFYLTRYLARQQVETVGQRLEVEARILAGELVQVPAERLELWAKAAEPRAQARITVIDAQGAVLADSQHDPETMENHAGRPEVREAASGRTGTAIRHSATLRHDLCYLAIPLGPEGRPGAVLRLAVPLEELDAAIASVRWRILAASAMAAAVAFGFAYFFSHRFTQRIAKLEAFAGGLTRSHFSETLPPQPHDEIGSLARSLDQMAARTRGLVDELSLESAQREAILGGMAEGVLAVDHELRVLFCNDSFTRAFAARLPVPQRLPLLELVRDPELLDLLSRVLATGETLNQRLKFPAADDRSFEIQAAPLAAPPRRGAIAVLHDITELERLERVRRDFVANVSHELRTPLTAIRGYTETLLNGALEDEENNRKFLEIIQAHAIRLNNIASDLLTLSEQESGKTGAALEAISVREALEAAFRTVESEAHSRGVSLLRGEIEDLRVAGSRRGLEQALVNLLDNAVKFNRPGGEVRAEAARTPDGQALITVADTGIGIPSEDLSRIFERFYRVDKGRSREMGGTGLGLSIVKHTIERMNGKVMVESQLGKGSTFTVLLPQ